MRDVEFGFPNISSDRSPNQLQATGNKSKPLGSNAGVEDILDLNRLQAENRFASCTDVYEAH
jgi:hypothetical protein